jgi:hypothetical protein
MRTSSSRHTPARRTTTPAGAAPALAIPVSAFGRTSGPHPFARVIGLGIWIAIAPGRAPGLTPPGMAPAMSMEQPEPSSAMP